MVTLVVVGSVETPRDPVAGLKTNTVFLISFDGFCFILPDFFMKLVPSICLLKNSTPESPERTLINVLR